MKKRIVAIIILVFMLLPLLSLTAVSADGETLPKGFVTLEEAFGIDYSKRSGYSNPSTMWYDYVDSKKIDGYYLQLDYVTFSCGGGPSLFGREGIHSDSIRSSLSQKPYITLRRGEVYEGFTVTGTSESFDSDGNVTARTTMTVTMESMFFGRSEDGSLYNDPYAYFSGSASSNWNRKGKAPGNQTGAAEKRWIGPTHENWDSTTYESYDDFYFVYRLSGTSEGDYPSNGCGALVWFRIVGVLLGDGSGGSYAGTTQNAEQNPGEDKGVSVPGAIAIGTVGAVISIAGAAAATSGGNDGTDDDKNKKSYKMYVQKDFGDAIRKGAEPVKIRARMAEVSDVGAEQDRNDLTAKITASGDGMTVENTALVGRYLEAVVSIPKDYEDDKAEITFTFRGVGGVFTNTVIFRAVDGPSLKFVVETEEAGAYRLNESSCGIDLISGDGFTYNAEFMIIDAVKPPAVSDITAENTGDFGVTFEETGRQFVYKMHVKNNTVQDPDHDVFAEKKTADFEIKVKVEGEEKPVTGYVSMSIYPEGITVQSSEIGKKKDVKYTVRVDVKIKEGKRERIQAYEGVVTSRKGGSVSETFTVRKKSGNVGINRVFPVNSPLIDKITVIKKGKVRRAKLNFLKGIKGTFKIKERN